MILKSRYNKGTDLGPHTHGLYYADRTDFGLVIGASYAVCGMVLFNSGLAFLLADSQRDPLWVPMALFEAEVGQIPPDWEFAFFQDEDSVVPGRRGRQAVWGYSELVHSDEHYEGLAELRPEAIRLFAERVGLSRS